MSYIGVPPFGRTVRTTTELTATAGQTNFMPAGGYIQGYVDVFLNGVSLAASDFTATDGTNIVLTSAAALNDEIKVIAYWPVSMVDTYRKGEVDAGFVSKDSSTGAALMPVGTTAQRPTTPQAGMYRLNTTSGDPEWYDSVNNVWRAFSNAAYSLDYLIIAGGGGGNSGFGNGNGSGGGGAGGYISSSLTSVISGTSFSVIIGAGGAGGSTNLGSNSGGSPGLNGSNSSFSTFTSIGGGRGTMNDAGGSGGSGGGGNPGGGRTIGQGNVGGLNDLSSVYIGGGGGGASTAGTNGASGGNGGNGSTWLDNVTRAGGGGGGRYPSGTPGSGGSGGGGSGGTSTGAGGAGIVNTGSGGGGGGSPGTGSTGGAGGNGGSGVVIIRYLGLQRAAGGTVTSSGGYTYHTFTSSGTFIA